MLKVFIHKTVEGSYICYTLNENDIKEIERNINAGAIELTEEQKRQYGMLGKEEFISPSTVEVNPDTLEVIFTPPSNEELAEQERVEQLITAKEERADAVSHITVEVDGMIFDGDESAQDRMSRVAAIASSEELSTELPWVLADNTVAVVTVAQIKEALRKALYAQAALWVVPYTEIE